MFCQPQQKGLPGSGRDGTRFRKFERAALAPRPRPPPVTPARDPRPRPPPALGRSHRHCRRHAGSPVTLRCARLALSWTPGVAGLVAFAVSVRCMSTGPLPLPQGSTESLV